MKSIIRALIVLLVGSLLASVASPLLAQEAMERSGMRPDAPQYAIRGPHPVGYRSVVIGEGTEDSLAIDMWYPALNPEGATEEITYELDMGNPDWLAGEPAVAYGQALLDAPIDDSMGPYPLIVFSHGFSGSPEWRSTALEHYASHGFVVLAPTHANEQDWMEIVSATVGRPFDIVQTLDYAEEITAPGGDFAGQIDMDNVAVVGHSTGGYTALAAGGAQFDMEAFTERCAAVSEDDPNSFLCMPLVGKEEQLAEGLGLESVPEGLWPSMGDPRVTAIVSFAGDSYLFDKAGLAKITVPMMAIGGTADTGTPYDWGVKPSYDFASSTQKALVTFDGAEHMIGSNLCEDMPFLAKAPFYDFVCLDPVWDKARALDLTDHFTTAFLLDTLKGDTAAHAALAPEAVSFPGIEYQAEGFDTAQANEELVRRWLYHWDVAFGELEGFDELLADDFVSHNMPEGDREAVIAGVAAYREENPNTSFVIDNLQIAGDTAFLFDHLVAVPEGATDATEGEAVSPVFLTVLRFADGKLAERWLYVPMEP